MPEHTTPEYTYHVVFEVNVEGTDKWQSILNNLENLKRALHPEATEVLVVTHGKGLGLIKKTDNEVASRLAQMADTGTVFAACRNTMARQQITADALLSFVVTVDSGIAEVVRRQSAGWAYIKAGY